MNLQENIKRIKEVMGINELIIDIPMGDDYVPPTQKTYNEEFTILGKDMIDGKYEFIVGDSSPVGRFVIPPIERGNIVPELYLVNPTGTMEDAKNFFRCIGSLGSVLRDYLDDGNLPNFIIFNPSDDAHEKRYKSTDFNIFIQQYIGDRYFYYGEHGINAIWASNKIKSRL
jgi:hypothetical protein